MKRKETGRMIAILNAGIFASAPVRADKPEWAGHD